MTPIEIQNIIQSINNLSFNHEDLMSVVLEFADTYIEEHKKRLLALFDNPNFLQQSVLSARESLVLSVNGLILSEDVPFDDIIDGCVNTEAQSYHLQNMNLNPVLKKEVVLFWNSLRKDIFSTIYNQNKEFNKLAHLPETVLKDRLDSFYRKFS